MHSVGDMCAIQTHSERNVETETDRKRSHCPTGSSTTPHPTERVPLQFTARLPALVLVAVFVGLGVELAPCAAADGERAFFLPLAQFLELAIQLQIIDKALLAQRAGGNRGMNRAALIRAVFAIMKLTLARDLVKVAN